MRISLVAPFGLRARGTTRARVMPLARELARRGHEVAVFIPPYDSPEDSGRRWIEGGAAGIRGSFAVINIALPGIGRGSAAWHVWLGRRLWRAVAGWRPDVVHAFKPKGPSGLAAAGLWLTRAGLLWGRWSRRGASPALVVDADDWEGPGGWNDDPRTGYSSLQRLFFAWQERFGLSHADAWTVTSRCLRERAIGFGAAPERVFVLHNGVAGVRSDLQGNGWPAADVPLRGPSALLYTRFAGVRPADVAAIWLQVAVQLPQARLTVVGRGLAGEERELAGLPGVEVRGWVEPEALPHVFAGAAVAMAPWADTPSNRARHSAKVLELMAAGVPVVAYAVGELATTLGEAGVLVPPGDATAFARSLIELLTHPESGRRLASAARARIRDCFLWEGLVDVALAAYAAAGADEKTAR